MEIHCTTIALAVHPTLKLIGGRTCSKNYIKKLLSILRYENSRGFTEIKQVSAHSIQVCRGINAWNTLVLRVEHPYIVKKSEKQVGPSSMQRKLYVTDCSSKPKVHVLTLVSQKLHKSPQ